MSLLGEICGMAVEGSSDLETLLRKCQVLATRLKSEDFKKWIKCELDGYTDGAEVPSYRQFPCQSRGTFHGYGRQVKNALIPPACIPKEHRHAFTTAVIRESVAALLDIAAGEDTGVVYIPWPANSHILFGKDIFEDLALMEAHKVIPKPAMRGILSTVRNRILSFALELEGDYPEAGEALSGVKPPPAPQVEQIVHTHIYGPVGNLAVGDRNTMSAQVIVTKGDFSALEESLSPVGLDQKDIAELKEAVTAEPKAENGSFGNHVSSWFGKVMKKAASGTLKVTTDVAASVISKALEQYYGLGSS